MLSGSNREDTDTFFFELNLLSNQDRSKKGNYKILKNRPILTIPGRSHGYTLHVFFSIRTFGMLKP